MKINSKDFRMRGGDKVKLNKWPVVVKPFYKSKERLDDRLRAERRRWLVQRAHRAATQACA